MATTTLTLRIKLAWWVPLYVNTLAILCHLLNAEPNMDRVRYWIGRGVKVRVY
jgi:hypothetical protein